MSGPNTPRGGSGSTGPGVGSEVSETLGGFDAIRSLVENEERIESLYKRRMASFDDAGNIGRGPYRQGNSVPLIMTTESFAAQGRYIIFWAGPKDVQWRFPMRAAQQQTKSGTILHTWKNGSRSTFFDEPEAAFTFQAGNIMPVRIQQRAEGSRSILHQLADPFLRFGTDGVARPAPEVIAMPAGLFDFYEFFELLNEEKILPDGRPNFVLIAYSSLVYPEIFLRGFFNPDGISFSESAEDPASLSWTSTFKVRSTSPPFYNSSQLMASWRSANTNGASSMLPPATSGQETPGRGG